MSTPPLRAVIVGSGAAAVGHVHALRCVGVEVVALCARREEAARSVAGSLGIPRAATDWQRTLDELRPDMLTLATTAALRGPVLDAAARRGIHVYCEKPLATRAGEAKRLYEAAEAAGIRHAYAATLRYEPSVAWLAELVAGDAIGTLREVAWTARFPLPRVMPWTWNMSRAEGGGTLGNSFSHGLAVLERITGGRVARVTGDARPLCDAAPVLPDGMSARDLTPETAESLEWRACDTEGSFRALMTFETPTGAVPVSARVAFDADVVAVPEEANGLRLYGSRGTLTAAGMLTFTIKRYATDTPEEGELLEVPRRLAEAIPDAGGPLRDHWAALARAFVQDIRGQEHEPYLTFREGWRYQEAADAIRAADGWRTLVA